MKRNLLTVLVAVLLVLPAPASATSNTLSVGGGVTSPHSEGDSNSCLDAGWFGNASYNRNIFSLGDRLVDFKLGGTFWHFAYTESDREYKGAERTNTRQRNNNIITVDGRVQVNIWKIRPFLQSSFGLELSGNGGLYRAIVTGLSLKITDSFSLELYRTELRDMDTWHRIKGINVCFEF